MAKQEAKTASDRTDIGSANLQDGTVVHYTYHAGMQMLVAVRSNPNEPDPEKSVLNRCFIPEAPNVVLNPSSPLAKPYFAELGPAAAAGKRGEVRMPKPK